MKLLKLELRIYRIYKRVSL